jgi:hypothetical protein
LYARDAEIWFSDAPDAEREAACSNARSNGGLVEYALQAHGIMEVLSSDNLSDPRVAALIAAPDEPVDTRILCSLGMQRALHLEGDRLRDLPPGVVRDRVSEYVAQAINRGNEVVGLPTVSAAELNENGFRLGGPEDDLGRPAEVSGPGGGDQDGGAVAGMGDDVQAETSAGPDPQVGARYVTRPTTEAALAAARRAGGEQWMAATGGAPGVVATDHTADDMRSVAAGAVLDDGQPDAQLPAAQNPAAVELNVREL